MDAGGISNTEGGRRRRGMLRRYMAACDQCATPPLPNCTAETTERRALRDAYRAASRATRGAVAREIEELDHLSGEGLD
jgi:hypothetical protein